MFYFFMFIIYLSLSPLECKLHVGRDFYPFH